MPKFHVTTRTVVEKRYTVVAPSAKAALIPIEQLVEHWPHAVITAGTEIVNVQRVPKKKR